MLPALHRSDDEASLGHGRSVEDSAWGRRGAERVQNPHLPQVGPQGDLFLPTPYCPCALDWGTVPCSAGFPRVALVTGSLICPLHGSLV